MLKQTPFNSAHKALGAKLVPFAGYEMPVLYTSIIEEHKTVRKSAGVFDIGHMGLIKISGEGALDLLQKVTTNDVSKLDFGMVQYSAVCNESGGTQDDILVYRFAGCYLVVMNASNADKILKYIEINRNNNTEIKDLKDNNTMLAIQGPKAVWIMEKISKLQLSNIKHRECVENKIFDVKCWYSKTGYTGEEGFEIFFEKTKAEQVWNEIIKAGAKPCGIGCRDTLRLEASLPLYGHELEENISPLEAGQGWIVKFDKGEFVGRSALLKLKEKGLTRKLVGIEVLEKAIPRQGYKFFVDNKEIGNITSGTMSPTLNKPIGMAYVDIKYSEIGTELQIEVRGNLYKCVVVNMPFYRRTI